MEDDLLSRVLLVTSPSLLEENHADSINGLCHHHQLVILMHFGDEKYNLPTNYCLPANAKVIPYDYETLDAALESIEDTLSLYNIDLISRHRSEGLLPFVLGGSILQVPSDVELSFFSSQTPRELEKTSVDISDAEWDL